MSWPTLLAMLMSLGTIFVLILVLIKSFVVNVVVVFSKLDKLDVVVLRGENVYGSPASDDLEILVPSITNLDISKNLLSSWEHVADIAVQLKNLRSLNVR